MADLKTSLFFKANNFDGKHFDLKKNQNLHFLLDNDSGAVSTSVAIH